MKKKGFIVCGVVGGLTSVAVALAVILKKRKKKKPQRQPKQEIYYMRKIP